jgi:hypothetical protein
MGPLPWRAERLDAVFFQAGLEPPIPAAYSIGPKTGIGFRPML